MVPYNIVVLLSIILFTGTATPLPPFVTSWTTEKMLNGVPVALHVVLPNEVISDSSVALIHSRGVMDDTSSYVLALSLKNGKILWSKGPWTTSAVQFNSSTVLLKEYGPDPEKQYSEKLGFSIVDAITGEILLSRRLEIYNDSSVVHLSSSDSIYFIRRNGYSGPSRDINNTIFRLSGPSYDPKSPAASVPWMGSFPFSGILRTAQRAGLLLQYEGTTLRSLNPIDLTERWSYPLLSHFGDLAFTFIEPQETSIVVSERSYHAVNTSQLRLLSSGAKELWKWQLMWPNRSIHLYQATRLSKGTERRACCAISVELNSTAYADYLICTDPTSQGISLNMTITNRFLAFFKHWVLVISNNGTLLAFDCFSSNSWKAGPDWLLVDQQWLAQLIPSYDSSFLIAVYRYTWHTSQEFAFAKWDVVA